MSIAARILPAAILLAAVAAPATAQQPAAQPQAWDQLPRMQLERQFAGPLKDTIVQRWRDPGAGTVCYIYLPITAPHTPPAPGGYVQYGPNAIGSISCIAGAGPAQSAAARPATAPAQAGNAPAAISPKRP